MYIIFMIWIAGFYIFMKYFSYFAAFMLFCYIIKFMIGVLNPPAPLTVEREDYLPGLGLRPVIIEYRTEKIRGSRVQVRYYTTKDYQKFRYCDFGPVKWTKYNEKTRKWEAIQN